MILIDDGIATGSTMKASISYMKKIKAKRIVVAVPVAPADKIESLRSEIDELICLYTPENFIAVGQFYEEFPQVQDSEVIQLLKIYG